MTLVKDEKFSAAVREKAFWLWPTEFDKLAILSENETVDRVPGKSGYYYLPFPKKNHHVAPGNARNLRGELPRARITLHPCPMRVELFWSSPSARFRCRSG